MENSNKDKKSKEYKKEQLDIIINEIMAHDPNSTWNKILDYKILNHAILETKLSLEKIVYLELCQKDELKFYENQ
jgi:hypothetical protein